MVEELSCAIKGDSLQIKRGGRRCGRHFLVGGVQSVQERPRNITYKKI